MPQNIDWENRIGRRVKLRDLHVFSAVVRHGSMAGAANRLRMSQPAVWEIMADLEQALGVRLLDRSRRGVEPTIYGRVLLKGAAAAFDDLRQSVRDIESLADPTTGELRIGCPESIASAILPPVVRQFFEQYPRVILHVHRLAGPTLKLPELHERSLDIILTRIVPPLTNEGDGLNVEILFDDEMVMAAGTKSRWAHRSKIDLVELVNEPWILTPPDTWSNVILMEAFRALGLDMPKPCLTTFSVPLRTNLVATGPFITILPRSALSLDTNRLALKILPVDLGNRSWPFASVTLKNRTLSPIAQRFIDHLRAFTRSMAAEPVAGSSFDDQPGIPTTVVVR